VPSRRKVSLLKPSRDSTIIEFTSTCAHVDEWEVEAAIKRFSFLRKDLPTWRVFITNGKETMAHLEETLHLPFLNTGGARPQYLASEQACKYLRSFG